jgi:HSP20 family protein
MYLPQVDVCERPQEIVILVEMPGVERQDVSIGWKDQILTISGNKRQRPADSNKARYMCVERSYGQFRREIAIGIPIDYKNARAELKNGLMKIHLPKVPTEKGQDTIPIE